MRFRSVVSLFFFILIAGLGAFYFIGHRDEFSLISTVSVSTIGLILLVKMILMLLHSVQMKVVTDHYDLGLSLLRCFNITRVTSFSNLFLPLGGGASLKAVYLKRQHGFSFSSFLATMGITNIIKILVNSIAAIAFIEVLYVPLDKGLLWAAIAIGVATALFLLFAHKAEEHGMIPFKRLKVIAQEWNTLRKDNRTIVSLFSISIAILVFSALQIYLVFNAFMIDLPFAGSGLIAAIMTISSVFALLPGNFGVKEAIIITVAAIYGASPNEGLHAAALNRLLSIALTLVIAPTSAYKLPLMEEEK